MARITIYRKTCNHHNEDEDATLTPAHLHRIKIRDIALCEFEQNGDLTHLLFKGTIYSLLEHEMPEGIARIFNYLHQLTCELWHKRRFRLRIE